MCVFFSSSLPTTYTDMPVDLFYFIIHIYQILLSTRIKFITIQSIGFDVLLFVPRQFWHGRLMARCTSIFGLWRMLSSNLINFDTLFFGFFCPVWHPIIFIRRPHRTRKTKEIQCRKNSVYCIIIISRHCKSHIYYRDLTERLTQQWAFDEFNRVVRIPLLRIDQSTWCVV